MEHFIESGFWHAILVVVIVTIISALIRGVHYLIFKKNYEALAGVVTYALAAATYIYIWQIRHGIGWLIFGIFSILGLIGAIVTSFVKKKP
jgi:hypothetical protein